MQYLPLQLFSEIESMVAPKTAKPKDASFYLALASLGVTVIGIPIMFLAWIEPHLENDQKNEITLEVGNQLKEPLAKMGETNTRLAAIEGSLGSLKPFIHDVISHQFESASKLPTGALIERIPALKDLLLVAKDQNVRVNPKIVAHTGAKFIDSSSQNAAAWGAALDLLNYRSFLNADFRSPSNTVEPLNEGSWSFMFPLVDKSGVGKKTFRVEVVLPTVPAAKAAQVENIGVPLNASRSEGPPKMIFSANSPPQTLKLDGLYLKNIEIVGFIVTYSGGPLVTDNVLFVNCTFVMPSQQNSRDFASAILSENAGASVVLSKSL